MNPTDIFPDTPEVTDTHRRSLAFSNALCLREWLKTVRTPVTLKRAILIELERGKDRIRETEIVHKLVVALQRAERKEIGKRIKNHLKNTRQ